MNIISIRENDLREYVFLCFAAFSQQALRGMSPGASTLHRRLTIPW